MPAASIRIAVVYGAGNAVVALPAVLTTLLMVACISSTGIAVIAILESVLAFSRITGINSAGISVTTIGHIHACCPVVRVFGAIFFVITACGCIVALSSIAVIVCGGISIIAGIMFIAAMRMMGHQSLA
jgi:hypothetical protein